MIQIYAKIACLFFVYVFFLPFIYSFSLQSGYCGCICYDPMPSHGRGVVCHIYHQKWISCVLLWRIVLWFAVLVLLYCVMLSCVVLHCGAVCCTGCYLRCVVFFCDLCCVCCCDVFCCAVLFYVVLCLCAAIRCVACAMLCCTQTQKFTPHKQHSTAYGSSYSTSHEYFCLCRLSVWRAHFKPKKLIQCLARCSA